MSPWAEGIECIKKQVGCIGIIRHFFNNKVFKLMAVIQEKKKLKVFYQIVRRISQAISL